MIDPGCPLLNFVQNNSHFSIISNVRQIFFDMSDTKSSKTLAVNYIHKLSKLHCLFGVSGLQVGSIITVLAHRREESATR